MLIYSLFRSAREGPADKQACTLFSQQKRGGAGWENLVNPSPEPGLYIKAPTLRAPGSIREGVKKAGAREAKEVTSGCIFIFLAAVAFIHATPATTSTSPSPFRHLRSAGVGNLADAKQGPTSESRESGKKPWRLCSSSEVPQVNLLSSPNSSTDLHAHTRPLVFVGSSSIYNEHVMETR